MDSVGARIKQIRLEKGLTLEDVHKKTKIHLNILKAIEEDNPVSLSPVYLKSFLKIYCKFLGIEPTGYIPGRKETHAPKTAEGVEKKQSPSLFKTATLKIGSFRLSKKIKKIFGVLVIAVVFSALLFKLGKFISSRPRPAARPAYRQAGETRFPQKQVAANQAKKMPKKTSDKKFKVPEDAITKGVSSAIRLGILVKETCWVTLKADGRIVFHGSLKKGKSETWQAKEKFELSLSNAGVVDLVVNGERILPLGKKGQARKLLITKEGLSVAQ